MFRKSVMVILFIFVLVGKATTAHIENPKSFDNYDDFPKEVVKALSVILKLP